MKTARPRTHPFMGNSCRYGDPCRAALTQTNPEGPIPPSITDNQKENTTFCTQIQEQSEVSFRLDFGEGNLVVRDKGHGPIGPAPY